MKRIPFFVALMLFFACNHQVMKYPETKKMDVTDTIHGVVIEDPYRWLEDDLAEETAEWVTQQNEVTFSYLNKLPYREEINKRLTELWDYPKTGTPFTISNRWFVFKNNGLQNQNVLFLIDDFEKEPQLLLDPNTLSEDGTVAFAGMDVSPDGKKLVYKIARSGSDWNEIYVMDIDTKQLLPDHLLWVKFSGISCYENGFFYSAYDKPDEGSFLSNKNSGQKVYFHEYGNAQENDKLVFSNPLLPQRMYSASVDDSKTFMFLFESESTSGNGLYIKNLKKNNSPLICLAEGFEKDYTPIEVVEGKVLVLTNHNAPRYRVVLIDPANPDVTNWQEIIPEKENTLLSCNLLGGNLIALYMEHAKSKVEIFTPSGTYLRDVELPGICSVNSFNGTTVGDTAFYSFSSYNTPGTIYRYAISTGKSDLFFTPEVKFNPDDFVIKQEFYKSADGTSIPMFIVHRKDLKINGKNPAMLYGYGGFNISLTPSFSVATIMYLEKGGIYAVANIRGGGEYGEEWHQSGTKLKKQNVFDDFIAAAEYLIESGYSNPDQLTIRGGSNGGLLVGAVTNQRPDLFKVALPAVGVLDMLRYQKFTIGYAWATDYGTVDESEEMFQYLLNYSPYHNVKAQDYPAILATTADHDDRVVPAHTFKYISRVQELNTGKLPTLVRIDVKAGHGSGKPTTKIIEEFTDIFSFVFYHTNIKW